MTTAALRGEWKSVFTKSGYKLGFWGNLGQKSNWANPVRPKRLGSL